MRIYLSQGRTNTLSGLSDILLCVTTILAIILVAVLWGGADFIRKLVTPGSSYQMLSFFFNLGVFLPPFLLLIWLFLKKSSLKYKTFNLGIALLAGLAAGLGGILIFYVFSKGGHVSVVIPAIRVLSILIVAVGGILIFSEPFNLKIGLGLLFSLLGVYLLLYK
jgi:drug/metabolite transporter (DMT)-like permease